MSGLSGCGGRLCQTLRRRAKKFDCVRYYTDEFSVIDAEHTELSYKICGRIYGKISQSASSQTDVPGKIFNGYYTNLELLVIMASNDILSGDIINDGESQYRIVGKICDVPMKFSLERTEIPTYTEALA